MKANIVLNIADVHEFVLAGLKQKFPDVEVTGYIVKSWNKTVFEVEESTMIEPIRHNIYEGHKELK